MPDMPMMRRPPHYHVRLDEQLEIIRRAPRDDAKTVLDTLLDAVFGQGFIAAVDELHPQASITRATGAGGASVTTATDDG